jgi:hypothetical protein
VRREEIRARLYRTALDANRWDLHILVEELRPGPRQAVPDEELAFLQFLVHDLYHRGLIVPDHLDKLGGFGPTWELTEEGRVALQNNDLLALDPSGFVAQARANAPELPDNCWDYLTDAVACLDRHLVRPAAVMLGVAAEIAAMQLAAVIVRKAAPSRWHAWVTDRRSYAAKWSSALEIARSRKIWEQARDSLETHDHQRRTDIDRIEDQTDSLLTVIRFSRNDAGHAAPVNVTEVTVRAFLAAFPEQAATLSRVIDLIMGLTIPSVPA